MAYLGSNIATRSEKRSSLPSIGSLGRASMISRAVSEVERYPHGSLRHAHPPTNVISIISARWQIIQLLAERA